MVSMYQCSLRCCRVFAVDVHILSILKKKLTVVRTRLLSYVACLLWTRTGHSSVAVLRLYFRAVNAVVGWARLDSII